MNRISEIKILKGVPFEKDTNTSMTFDSLSEQVSYFSSYAIKSFTNQTFVKGFMYKKVRLQCDIDEVYKANYLMFKNNDGKWFFAYITGFEFVSELATEITFELDYIQSYMGDIVFQENDIERQHTLNDSFEYVINEIDDPLVNKEEYIIDDKVDYKFEDWKVAIMYKPNLFLKGVGSDPTASGNNGWTNTDTGGTYVTKDTVYVKSKADYDTDTNKGRSFIKADKFYSGAMVLYMNIASDTDRKAIEDKLTLLETTGYNVIKVMMVPKDFAVSGDNLDVAKWEDYAIPRSPYYDKLLSTGGRGFIDGYLPKNNKLYFYPFTKLNITNFQGKQKDYRYERFNPALMTTERKPIMRIYMWCFGDLVINCFPSGYLDGRQNPATYDDVAFDTGLSIEAQTDCIWNYDTFIKNVVHNLPSMAVGLAGAIATGGMSLALSGLGKRASSEEKIGLGVADRGAKMVSSALEGGEQNGSMQSVNGQAMIMHELYGFSFRRMVFPSAKLKIYDDLFSKYGYYFIGVNGRPNILGRKRYNYVKIRSGRIGGDIPIEARRDVIEKLQNGYTFWHDKNNIEYGNFEGTYFNEPSTKTLTSRGTIF